MKGYLRMTQGEELHLNHNKSWFAKDRSISYTRTVWGGVAEWTMATVLKTVFAKANVGSNPTPSAISL
jgi:hypothetical protein